VTLPPPPNSDPFLPPPPAATYGSPQPYAPGYAYPNGFATPPAAPGATNTAVTNTSATIAFVLALLGLVLTPVVDIAAVVVGHHALATIRRTGEQGAGLAKAALAIGYSLLGLGALVVAFFVAAVAGSIAQ
jgi:hypothetical protein